MAGSSLKVLFASIVCISVHYRHIVSAQATLPVIYDTVATTAMTSTAVMNNVIPNWLAIRCRNVEDVLLPSNLTVNAGDSSCVKSAVNCASRQVVTCTQQQARVGDRAFVAAARRCLSEGFTSNRALTVCVLPAVLKKCTLSGCSACQSSVDATFDNKCTSSGGQLCRVALVSFGHRALQRSVCAPAQCGGRLLATSLAKTYADVIGGKSDRVSSLHKPDILDHEISCGSGAQKYTVRSSAAKDFVFASAAGSRFSHTTSRLAASVLFSFVVASFLI